MLEAHDHGEEKRDLLIYNHGHDVNKLRRRIRY
jgi:hypothetical protein